MIQGCDISRWQGTEINWPAMKAAGIEFVYIKASQGVSLKDTCFDANVREAKRMGILVGAYHFCTNDKAGTQYKWFVTCIGDHKLDLPPALDVEANGGVLPGGDTVEEICKRLRGFQGFPLPVIYTNAGFGNRVFPSPQYARMAEYPLWVANWGVQSPVLPAVWAKAREPYAIWQDNVVDGAPYGVNGKLDHDIWGSKLPFPKATEVAPQPAPQPIPSVVLASLAVTIDGITYTAKDVRLSA